MSERCMCETCTPHSVEMRMILCPICGNKRCPHATDHRNACKKRAKQSGRRVMTFRHQKRAVEMTGQRFGRLVVLRRAGSDGNGRARWACRCDCGGNATYLRQVLIAGEAKSCGCLHIETARANLRPYARPAPVGASPCTLAEVWR